MTIGVIVPNDYFAPWDFVHSIFKLPPKYFFKDYRGALVDKNRNYIWEEMRIENKESLHDLLFIDSDIVFEPEDVATIENDLKTYDIVTGVYIVKAWDWKPAIFKKTTFCKEDVFNVKDALTNEPIKAPRGDYDFVALEEGIFEVEACGAGFLGISHRVINSPSISLEPFNFIREDNVFHGEDVSFCQRAREAGFKIYCDSSIKLGHLKTQIIKVGDKEPDIY